MYKQDEGRHVCDEHSESREMWSNELELVATKTASMLTLKLQAEMNFDRNYRILSSSLRSSRLRTYLRHGHPPTSSFLLMVQELLNRLAEGPGDPLSLGGNLLHYFHRLRYQPLFHVCQGRSVANIIDEMLRGASITSERTRCQLLE